MGKKLTFLVLLTFLAASAMAGVPDNALRSISKAPILKQQASSPMVSNGVLDCSAAEEANIGDSFHRDTTGLPDNVTYYGCSTWTESGGEYIFHMYLATEATWQATVTANGCDLDLIVLDSCDEDLGCLIVVDSSVVTNVPVSGDFYFVVDGYNGAACDFTFSIEDYTPPPPPPPASFCDLVDDDSGTHFEGTTCNGVNLVESMDCFSYTEAGYEYYYEIFMPSGSSFTATVTNTADGALWVTDSCEDPMTCLAYADDTLSGDPEVISYTNSSGSDMVVYLGIDSWGTDSCGDYVMDFVSTTGAVANEAMSMGAVKSLFR